MTADETCTQKRKSHDVTYTTARLYTADYLGAAVGALSVSTLLIPVVGMSAVCYLTAGLCLASCGVLMWSVRSL